MPCYDGGGPSSSGMSYQEEKRLKIAEALLCGILTAMAPTPERRALLFQVIDWNKAGISPGDALEWWIKHLEKDERK